MLKMFWTGSSLHPIFTYIPFKVQMFFTLQKPCPIPPQFCSCSCFSYGDVIYGISYFYSLGCLSCGDVIYGTSAIYLIACTIGCIVLTTICTTNGSSTPLIIFYAFKFVLSCSFFTLEHEVPPSTLFFLFKTLLKKSNVTFFLLSSVICISSLILLTLANGFYGLSF